MVNCWLLLSCWKVWLLSAGWSSPYGLLFFFKQKTAYEMRISDWSSDVCSSDLGGNDAWQYIAAPAFGHGGVAGTIEITTAFGGSKARMGTFEDDMDFFSGSKFPKQRKPPGISGTFTGKTAEFPDMRGKHRLPGDLKIRLFTKDDSQ